MIKLKNKNIINLIEKKRLKNKINIFNLIEYRFFLNFIRGELITIWYVNRELEDSSYSFQVFKGICIYINNNNYKTNFKLRNVIDSICIEQLFFFILHLL